VARFELAMLAELGFGLDLESCAATGGISDLTYVSPKSGRAVSREAGEPWRDKLMRLPAFLSGDDFAAPSAADLASGFEITGFFLARHFYEPRGLPLPDARRHFIAAIVRALPSAA
jgi:DNA repair protein RecO (recombination protein O)